jgi:TonB family protein
VRRAVASLIVALALVTAARAEELSKPPKLTHFVEAPPPATLAGHGRVEVILTIDLDERGRVQSVTVAQPGPAGEGYDEAALAAAKQFEFTPGEAAGKAVPVRITYKYIFLYKAPPPPPVQPPPSEPESESASESAPDSGSVPFSGQVLSKGDRVPISGVSVVVGTHSTVTDDTGRFRFPSLPPGKHRVYLRGAGITATENPLTLTSGKRVETTYYVTAKQRWSATVRGARAVEETVEQTISVEELKRIPGTQGDTLKAVQNLPGLARSPFGSGLLVVWGSAPLDTRVYADGVFIPTLYHFGGLRSTVNSELVSDLIFTPGGYGVEHGRGLGGVVDIESRRPRTDGYHGFAQIDAIDASAMFEGKISKNVSFAVALRRSTVDAWIGAATPNNVQVVPTYWDYQAKLHWKISSRDDLDAFVFGSDDLLHVVSRNPDSNADVDVDSHIYYHRALARWTHHFTSRATLSVTASLGYDVPFQFRATAGNFPISVDAETFEYTIRAVARVPLASFVRLDAGLDFEGNRFTLVGQTPVTGAPREGDPGFGNQGGRSAGYVQENLTLNLNQVAPFVSLNFKFGKWTITPGLRLDIYDWAGYQNSPDAYNFAHALWEPRFQIRYQIAKWCALKAATGIYHQAPDPTAFLRVAGNPAVPPQFAVHYVAGADFDPTPTLHIEVEGFYKDMRQLVVRGQTPADPALVTDGRGRVYGGELLVRQQLFHNFFGWVAYTLSRAERQDHPGDPWRIFQFDQTHILTLIASYKLPRGYQVGLRFRYVTGNPYTPVTSPNGVFDANTGSYRAIYAQPVYSGRVADFHQLDVRFDKEWLFNRWKLAVYLDLQNVYNNRAPEATSYNFNYTQSQPVAGLPIIPDLGIRGEF